MIELGRLYQEIAELVHMQEPAVEQIDQQAEDVVGNVQHANTQIDSAISSARKARKWKWYALLIISECPLSLICMSMLTVVSVLIIAIVVGVAVGVTQANKSAK